MFFHCLLLRRARATATKTNRNSKPKMRFKTFQNQTNFKFLNHFSSCWRVNPPKNTKMASRRLPGSLRRGPRRPQEQPKAAHDGPKSRQERPKSRPEAVLERPGWPPGAALPAKRAPEASRRPSWPLWGVDFGLSGGPFPKVPLLFGQPSGKQAEAQAQAQGARRNAQAQAQFEAWFFVISKPSIPEALGGRRGSRSD